MCGIIGIYGGHLDRLAAANELLQHRGPDDSGVFADQALGVGLAHRRLSIVDLSPMGHQPMVGADGGVVLVFNGEIYNFRELRSELEKQGYTFRGHSDTEVLLNLYLAEGESMLTRLNGIFAIALWDKRKKSLLLARDALGVKPLYYAALDGHFAFASEIKALLHLLPEARELDAAALHRYISFLWCPGDGTPLKAVRKLCPGGAMWVRDGQIERHWKWYSLPAVRGIIADLDEAAALQGTVIHLRQAVHRQMVADVPVGAFLSGGLDSSSVAHFAQEKDPNLHCFTIDVAGDLEDGETDDLPYARKVAKYLGLSLDIIKIDVNRMAADLETMVAQLDEPLADPAPLNVLYISQLARSKGIKVLLSGTGGDDLFTGYRRHRALQAEHFWNWLPQYARSGLSEIGGHLDQRRTWSRRLSKLFSGAGLDKDARMVNYFSWAREADLFSLYTPDFRRLLGTALTGAPMLEFLQSLDANVEPMERMLALEQRFFLADHNLIYTDKMSMAAGVEVRVPFLDLDLVEFAARIPSGMKQRGSEGKWVLKKAMEPYLPHDVIYRPKTGFGAPLRHWMQHNLSELIGDLMSVDSLKRRGLFEPAAVQQLIKSNFEGQVDASYTLLSLMCIEIWCRRFVDNK